MRHRRGWLIHIFERVCLENGIEHRLTKPYHPWTNGQAERMVRTIKEATVKSFHYTSINELRRHVRDWLVAYNFAKQLKALRFKTPYDAIEELWKSKRSEEHTSELQSLMRNPYAVFCLIQKK